MVFRKFLLVLGLAFLFSPAFAFADSCILPDVCARIVITNFKNTTVGTGNMTDNIFVGQAVASIPSGQWFSVYKDGSFVVDPDIAAYADVPGLAVERQGGKIRIRLFATHTDGSTEHVEGFVELSSGGFIELQNDLNPKGNGMDNWEDSGMKAGTLLGKDGAWLDSGKSYFFMTASPANDSYFSILDLAPVISLVGDKTFYVNIGEDFIDPGATAYDPEDKDLTAKIVSSGTVSTTTPGIYPRYYDVSDSKGIAATQGSRDVVVQCLVPEFTSEKSVTATAYHPFTYAITAKSFQTATFTIATSSLPSNLSFDGVNITGIPYAITNVDIEMTAVNNCGTTTEILHITVNSDVPPSQGGGGNPILLHSIKVFGEKIENTTATSTIIVSWKTDLPSDSRVAFGTTSASFVGDSLSYGYSNITSADTLFVTDHSVVVSGLDTSEKYYFRPISKSGSAIASGIELSRNPIAPVIFVSAEPVVKMPVETVAPEVVPQRNDIQVFPAHTSPSPAEKQPSPVVAAIIRNRIVPTQNTVIRNSDIILGSSTTEEMPVSVTGRKAFRGMLGAAYGAVADTAASHRALAVTLVLLAAVGSWYISKRFYKKPEEVVQEAKNKHQNKK